jgi:hypothetical protein
MFRSSRTLPGQEYGLEGGETFGINTVKFLAPVAIDLLDKMRHEVLKVFDPLAERRKNDAEYLERTVQFLCELLWTLDRDGRASCTAETPRYLMLFSLG